MNYQTISVYYKKEKVGALSWEKDEQFSTFQYEPKFIDKGVELAPLQMPLRKAPYQFANLDESFGGVPGLFADCLPDAFGNALIDEWLRSQEKFISDFSPLDRLCYIGNRGMGALEFKPALRDLNSNADKLEVGNLVELANKALSIKVGLSTNLNTPEGFNDILRVGTSAGGARAKGIIAWNEKTNEILSGQANAPRGFKHYILKFDGVDASFEGVSDPQGYCRIEYAYYLMAIEAGIKMQKSSLYEEHNRAHFITQRFDRKGSGEKVHYSSFFGMSHKSYASPSSHSHSYEDLFETIDRLKLSQSDKIQMFKRMVFNILSVNHDDHVKNFGFLFKGGNWTLSPAFDVTYSFNPKPGKWTARHQLSIMGKREGFNIYDFIKLGRNFSVATEHRLKKIINNVVESVGKWERFALESKVDKGNVIKISNAMKLVGNELHR